MKNVKTGHSKPIVCLDAGHVGKYNRSPVVPAYYESDMNWKLHLLQKKYLEEYGIDVVLTRKTQDEPMNVIPRGEKAKGCDLLISNHSNACDTESVDRPVGIHFVDDNCGAIDEQSKEIATILSQTVQEVMQTQKAQVVARVAGSDIDGDGKKNDEYYGVLRGAHNVGVPAIILEHSFHTNTRAAKWLLDEKNLDRLAKREAAVIAEWFGMSKKEESTNDAAALQYVVQVGVYNNYDNAKAQLEKAKAAGINACIVIREKDNAAAKEPEKPAAKSVDEIAREVIAGKWGSGDERKKRLAAAGYDPSAVQQRVNEMLKG